MKGSSAFGFAVCLGAAAACLSTEAMAVRKQTTTVNGLAVYRYVWTDSAGRTRSVSIKRQGAGNPGNGGYAVQMTYQYLTEAGQLRTRRANSNNPNEGFGYFVSHERFRKFSDGSSAAIAQKIFGTSDSPLGRQFAATLSDIPLGGGRKGLEVEITYPRYGTKAANGIDPATGQDDPPLGTSPALFKRYDVPVKTRWYFQDGVDHPRIEIVANLGSVPGPDRLSVDLRGPYGKIDFDESGGDVRLVTWADRFYFRNTTQPLTNSSEWTWNQPNSRARFTALTIGRSEMGLLEPKRFGNTGLNDGYANGRGKTSGTYNCFFKLPCDGEWPYQSAQYELPNVAATPTNSEKIAWGSSAFYGTSLPSTYDGTQSVPFEGFPANKRLTYEVCVVLGQVVPGGLTREVATQGPAYNCASKM